MIIPLMTLHKLRVSLRKKLTLGLLFAAGSFAIISSLVRCIIAVTNPAGLSQVMLMLWSAVEECVFALVANGPIFRPLFFRGNDFAGDSNSRNRATGVTRSLHDIYEMTPKDNAVFSVVSSEPHKSAISRGNTIGVLRTVEVSVHTEDIKKLDEDGTSSGSSGHWMA
jgi:hypothetical protein